MANEFGGVKSQTVNLITSEGKHLLVMQHDLPGHRIKLTCSTCTHEILIPITPELQDEIDSACPS